MIRVAVIGDIGSGKSYVAKQFGYPIFNADAEVAQEIRNVDGVKKQKTPGANYNVNAMIPFRAGSKERSFRAALGFEASGLMDVTENFGAENPSQSYVMPIELGGVMNDHRFTFYGKVPFTARSVAEGGFRYFNEEAKAGFDLRYTQNATSSAMERVGTASLVLGTKDSNPSMIPTEKLRSPNPQ